VVELILSDSHILGKPSSSSDVPFHCTGYRRINRINYSLPSSVGKGRQIDTSFETCHNRVTLGGDTRIGPTYFALHIRRGDFQYGHTRRSAEGMVLVLGCASTNIHGCSFYLSDARNLL
jgi:hypothetical protein